MRITRRGAAFPAFAAESPGRPTLDHVRTAALVAAVLLAEAILAAGIVMPRLLPLVALVAGAGIVWLFARFPLVGIASTLVLVCSALPQAAVDIPAGPVELRPYELVLGALLAAALIAPRRRTWGGVAGIALGVFLLLAAVSALVGIQDGRVSLSDAFQWGRGFGVLTLFYAVVRLVPERRDLERLMTVAAVIAAGTGLAALAIKGGLPAERLLGSEADLYTRADSGAGLGGAERIRLPGVALAFGLVWWASLRLVWSSGVARLGWSAVLAGIVVNLALSFNRNMWAAALLGLVLILVLGGVSLRRPLIAGVVVLAGLTAGLVLLGPGIDRTSPLQPFVERGRTLLDPAQVQRESSLQDRQNETAKAWETFVGQPVLGVGVGAGFGAFTFERSGASGIVSKQRFLHNQYLYLLLIAGIPGLIAFLLFVGGVVNRALRRREDVDVLVWGVGVVMVMISAFFMISFADSNMAAALALLAGAAHAGAAWLDRPIMG